MQQRQLSRGAVAKRVGVNPKTISEWLRGKGPLHPDHVRGLLDDTKSGATATLAGSSPRKNPLAGLTEELASLGPKSLVHIRRQIGLLATIPRLERDVAALRDELAQQRDELARHSVLVMMLWGAALAQAPASPRPRKRRGSA